MTLAQSLPFFLLSILVSILVPLHYWRKCSPLVAIAWSYFLIQSAVFAFAPLFGDSFGSTFLLTVPAEIHKVLSSSKAWVLCLVVPVLVLRSSRRLEEFFIVCMIAFLCVDAVWISFKLSGHMGLMNAYSFDAGVMATFFPIAALSKNQIVRWSSAILLVGALVSGGSSGPICLGAALFGYLVSTRRFGWASGVILLALISLFAIPGASELGTRPNIWALNIERYLEESSMIFGEGLGTFSWNSLKYEIAGTRYYLMHNDYLQILVESGVVGLLLILVIAFVSLNRLKSNPPYFASAMALLTLALVYFPLQYLQTTVLALFMIKKSLDIDSPNMDHLRKAFEI